MAIVDMSAQIEELNKHLGESRKSARSVNDEMAEMGKSIFSLGKAIAALSLTEGLKAVFKWTIQQALANKEIIARAKIQIDQRVEMVKNLKAELDMMRAGGLYDVTKLKAQEDLIAFAEEKLKKEEQALDFRKQVIELGKKEGVNATAAFLIVTELRRAFQQMVITSHEYNRALINTNSNLGARFALVNRTLSAQAALGATTESMAESAQALVAHGNHLTPAYERNLKLVVQMKEGLGISSHNAAELVVVFSRQLKESAEKVANVIAQVAANTGLAAEKAASFATEIGRALRLIGPNGLGKEAAGVTRAVTTIAGRVEAIGGNSSAVSNLFKQMTGGSDQSNILRRMSGTNIQSMGTEAGVVAAMRRVTDVMNMRVNAADPEMYRFQLEQLSTELGVSANDLTDLRQVMQEWDKDMGKERTAAQAYREQTQLLGKSWEQIKTSLSTVVTQALLPAFEVFNGVISGIASFIGEVSTWGTPLIRVIQVGLVTAAGVSIYALGKLALTMRKMAMDSAFLNSWLETKGLPSVKGIEGIVKRLPSIIGGRIGLGGIAGMGLAGSAVTIGAGIISAAAVGAVAGRVLDVAYDKSPTWIKALMPGVGALKALSSTAGRWYAEWHDNARTDTVMSSRGALTAAHQAARLLAQQQMGVGGTTEAQVEAATRDAVEKFATMGVTEELTRGRIAGNAIGVAQNILLRNQYAGLTEKSTQERQLDARGKEAVKQLALMEANLKNSDAMRKQGEEQARLNALQLKKLTDETNMRHWQVAPSLELNTNAPAFRLLSR